MEITPTLIPVVALIAFSSLKSAIGIATSLLGDLTIARAFVF